MPSIIVPPEAVAACPAGVIVIPGTSAPCDAVNPYPTSGSVIVGASDPAAAVAANPVGVSVIPGVNVPLPAVACMPVSGNEAAGEISPADAVA